MIGLVKNIKRKYDKSTIRKILWRASFADLNDGDFQSEGAAEGGGGGDSAAPERSAGAKRRRSVPFQKSSSKDV